MLKRFHTAKVVFFETSSPSNPFWFPVLIPVWICPAVKGGAVAGWGSPPERGAVWGSLGRAGG